MCGVVLAMSRPVSLGLGTTLEQAEQQNAAAMQSVEMPRPCSTWYITLPTPTVLGWPVYYQPKLNCKIPNVFIDHGVIVGKSIHDDQNQYWLQLGADRWLPKNCIEPWTRHRSEVEQLAADVTDLDIRFRVLLGLLPISVPQLTGPDVEAANGTTDVLDARVLSREEYLSAKALFRDDIDHARNRELWGKSNTQYAFAASACTAFVTKLLLLENLADFQQDAQEKIVCRLLGNPRLWWDENNSQHDLLLYLQLAVRKLKAAQLPTPDITYEEQAFQQQALLTPIPEMDGATASQNPMAINTPTPARSTGPDQSPSTPDPRGFASHLQTSAFVHCWYAACGLISVVPVGGISLVTLFKRGVLHLQAPCVWRWIP